jgi:hypothetical protein
MFSDLKLPIVIISSIRTGSTGLLFELEKIFLEKGISPVVLNEPIVYNNKSDSVIPFLKSINTNQFILKVHAYDLQYYPKYFIKKLENNSYNIIRLRRKSIIDQCLSLYISLYTKIWINTTETNKQLENTTIEISEQLLHKTIEDVKKFNKAIDNCAYKFSLDLIYEDLELTKTFTVKRKTSITYEELRSRISKMIT